MGATPLYKTTQEMGEKIDAYFAENENYTITGLALYLGFCSRQSFYDYSKKTEFCYMLKRASLFIQNYYEEKLTCPSVKSVAGAIFALKQFGWGCVEENNEEQTDFDEKSDDDIIKEINRLIKRRKD